MYKCLLAVLILSLAPCWAAEKVVAHLDRPTPKIIFQPDYQVAAADADHTASAYLAANWNRLGLQPLAKNLTLVRTQKSLAGTHYHFQQTYQGLPVEFAEVVISVDNDNGRIFRVFNNTWSEPIAKRSRLEDLELDREEALDLAWEHLQVHGDLTAQPKAEKAWHVVAGQFQLVWRTSLTVEAPMGDWSVAVDAMNGEIVEAKDRSIYRIKREAEDYQGYAGPLLGRHYEMQRLRRVEADRQLDKAGLKRGQGTGTVFDPDPRTTLLSEDLRDSSPASAFTNAYETRALLDISEQDSGFALVGPWVQIINFSNPPTAPTISPDGVWDFHRGNNGFNDTMTYFHLDQSQRYIQSLGYTGERGIQNVSIEADTDGLNNSDNSTYTLSSNRLNFGHGCVDDNEDADVILHEYGHAIQNFINTQWDGGDTGAMGEGFGDYWGTSYSYKTPNGPAFHPAWIFTWDGHLNDCWNGRTLDQTFIQYDPESTYGDHESLPNGGESDELWGTPLFQSMLSLEGLGYPISDADQIILESHFGLGQGLRIPELAQATVDAAAMLFPNGPHAQVFHDNFAVNGIPTSVTPLPPTYTYYAAHVPPDNDWVNTIELANPSAEAATVQATVYELVDTDFAATSTTEFTINGNRATTFNPEGSAQRWIRFVSSKPLSGTSFFSRFVEGRGEEKAGIPLFTASDVSTSLIIPHIPSDRNFYSGAVILNPNDEIITLSYELYDVNGDARNAVLTASARQTLRAHEKWVGFLAPFPGVGSIFDDETDGGSKISYVKVNTSRPIVAFELFGYKATSDSPLATAGIKAQPDNQNTVYPIRATLTDALYTSFSVLNPNANAASVNVEVINRAGVSQGTIDLDIPARTKMLGLNINDPDNTSLQFFRVPYPTASINLSSPDDIAAVIITGPENLRVFELTGTGSSELDGGAVTPAADRVVFAKPSGILEIFKLGSPGNVIIRSIKDGAPTITAVSMGTKDFHQVVLDDPDLVIIEGLSIATTVITQDQAKGSITVVKGSEAEEESGN